MVKTISHTIIYPALLLSLNDGYHLPDYMISSEYLNVNDKKISKSQANGVTARELIDKYSSDTIRYCMIAQAPEQKDSNFNYELVTQLSVFDEEIQWRYTKWDCR